MKDDYLKRLEEELEKVDALNKEEVLIKYTKRYDFGLESEMSVEEIENMLGKPEDVAEAYRNVKPLAIIASKGFNLSVITLSDEIVITKSVDEDIHLCFKDTDEANYSVKQSKEGGIYVDYHTSRFFKLNRSKGKIIVELPLGVKFDSIYLKGNNTIFDFEKVLNANSINISLTAGEIYSKGIICDEAELHVSSASMDMSMVDAKNAHIGTISGDVKINKLYASNLLVDSISGDVSILESNAKYKVKSLIGKVLIGEMKPQNMKQKIKKVFISES